MFVALRQRNFALLWLGGLISTIGDWILNIGLPIYAYLLTRSVLVLSISILLTSIPNIVLGSLAGVFVDRWDRKWTLIIVNGLLALGLLPLLFVRTADRIWIVYVVMLVEASLEQFTIPAQNALLPTLIQKAQLVQANALNSLTSDIARFIGPALGGLIAAIFALNGIVLADVISFIVAALLIGLISVTKAASTESVDAQTEVKVTSHFWQEWIDGLLVIRSERTLSVLVATSAIMMLGEGVMSVLFPVFVYKVLHGQALQIGQLMSAQAIGGLLGGLLIGVLGERITSRLMSRWSISLTCITFGFGDLLIFNTPAFWPFYWVSVGLFIVVGVISIGRIGWQSLLQACSPDTYRGRIFGALGMVTGLTYLVGTVAAGSLTDRLGVVTVLNLQAMGYMLAGILVLVRLPRQQASIIESERVLQEILVPEEDELLPPTR
ncbi:MAG TPA: MFS transporter [Ktedonobacteraceae bacterium]|nr:MFS transporter [Ktedonobacteraceae bacterium]